MVRRFAVIGHRAPSSGKINLNDLAGSSGRLDVLARAVNTGLFLSHGIRDDTDIVLHLMGGPGPPRRIWFQGSRLRGVHPDERAIAGQIAKALRNPVPAIGQQIELHKDFGTPVEILGRQSPSGTERGSGPLSLMRVASSTIPKSITRIPSDSYFLTTSLSVSLNWI